MKKLMLLLLVLVTLASASTIIEIPNNVKSVQSAEYSSGGGNTAIVYVKIVCELNDGSFIMWNLTKTSASGLFGMGRLSIPEEIRFVKANVTKPRWR